MTVATYDRARCSLVIDGHCGDAPKGESLVCAAVTILGYTAIEAAKEYDCERLCMDGYVGIRDVGNEDLRRELDTVWRGLKLLAEHYPDYVQAKEA